MPIGPACGIWTFRLQDHKTTMGTHSLTVTKHFTTHLCAYTIGNMVYLPPLYHGIHHDSHKTSRIKVHASKVFLTHEMPRYLARSCWLYCRIVSEWMKYLKTCSESWTVKDALKKSDVLVTMDPTTTLGAKSFASRAMPVIWTGVVIDHVDRPIILTHLHNVYLANIEL